MKAKIIQANKDREEEAKRKEKEERKAAKEK